MKIHGAPSSWPASLVAHLGVVVAGLEPEELTSIVPLEAITREAFAHLNHAHLEKATAEHLAKFAPEALAQVRIKDFV